ncbi:MAG: translation initiation factor IF-3, partial [Elusimicrobia bacterium]|nr:translation initiation factor IF-3 [Elusimicrobiota bacterium]MBD3411697.1 translation initiation factor IF-3 [Elusimicrobiota bacterium]
PVCKILDYSKFKYNREKKLKEAKKRQRLSHVKEVRIRPRIGIHDLDVKIKHIVEFINNNDRVKVSIVFYGRENIHRELGLQVLDRVRESVSDIAQVEQQPKREGNRVVCMFVPIK